MRNDDATLSRNDLCQCPDCYHRGVNFLADGRCQCKRCRKKFTPRQRKCRLPARVVHDIASSFWLMLPAVGSSGSLGLNRKTVQRYYLILRLRIMKERERALRRLFGDFTLDTASFDRALAGRVVSAGRERHPVFGLLRREGEVWVILPEARGDGGSGPAAARGGLVPDCWVYARDCGAYETKDIDRFLCVATTGRGPQGICPLHGNSRDDFWLFAKQRLKKYYGGFKRNFPLFIREMEFRYNHRDDADAIVHLLNLLAKGPF